MISDDDLVRKAQCGDDLAFGELVSRHRTRVFSVALSVLGPGFTLEAEDVAQDAFLRAHRSIHGFRRGASFASWMYRIAFNLAANVRRTGRYTTTHCSTEDLDMRASASDDPQVLAEKADLATCVDSCVARLPEEYASAIRLYYWLGFSVSEVGDALGITENTAKSHLHRARKLLNESLLKAGYTYEV